MSVSFAVCFVLLTLDVIQNADDLFVDIVYVWELIFLLSLLLVGCLTGFNLIRVMFTDSSLALSSFEAYLWFSTGEGV